MANNFLFFTEDAFIGGKYPLYFNTSHWKNLKEKCLYSNSNAKCFICEKTSTLLLHHEKYDNLFSERLYRDLFVLCFECHKQLHFYKNVVGRKIKTKLTYRNLKKRRLLMRSQYLLNSGRIGLSMVYLVRCIFIL